VTYELTFIVHQPYLDGDGQPHVLVHVYCRDADVTAQWALGTGRGLRGQGLLVLDRTPTGFVAVDLVTVPNRVVSGWSFDDEGVLTTWTQPYGGGTFEPTTWAWNGQYFQP
jgi:hypothetical protein